MDVSIDNGLAEYQHNKLQLIKQQIDIQVEQNALLKNINRTAYKNFQLLKIIAKADVATENEDPQEMVIKMGLENIY